MNFRFDINGLRAISILLVLLYHFKVIGFDGGFVGVDIFFVISGFLMTKIIHDALDKKTFNLFQFYSNRAIRIIPALCVVLVILAILGYVVLIPEGYASFAEYAIASLLFYSNDVYSNLPSGYFDSVPEKNLLLHTWSLSVEWWFYFIYPILILVCRKITKNIRFFVLVLLVLSFCHSNYLITFDAKSAFFDLSSRAWELLLGGLVALFPLQIKPLHRKVLLVAGWVCILLAIVKYDGQTPWPAYHAILPTLGAALVIWANWQNFYLMRCGVVQALGTISYSLYLWHWPIVFFLAYFNLWIEASVGKWVGLMLSLGCGYLSYRWIEQPSIKLLKNVKSIYALSVGVVSMGLVFLILSSIQNHQGFPSRIPKAVIENYDYQNNTDEQGKQCSFSMDTEGLKPCRYGTGAQLKAVVWGDSHAASVVRAIAEAASLSDGYVLGWSVSNCPSLNSQYASEAAGINIHPNCFKRGGAFLEFVKTVPPDLPIIIINRLNTRIHGYNENLLLSSGNEASKQLTPQFEGVLEKAYLSTLCEVSHPQRKVYVLQPIPEVGKDVLHESLKYSLLFKQPIDVTLERQKHMHRSKEVYAMNVKAAKTCHVHLLDPAEYLCDQQQCFGSYDGVPYYFDDDHLSLRGARRLMPLFEPIVQ